MKKRLQLYNAEGRKLDILLRTYHSGDEPGMIACIRDEYGETYFKQHLYSADRIREEARSGRVRFLTAEALGEEREIAGILLLRQFYPEESMCEIASMIFRKKYRGFGLAMPFLEYGMDMVKAQKYSAVCCLPVLFHDTTQKLLYQLGLRATGFAANVFDMGKIVHSYARDRNRKHSQGIQILALEKKDAGILYLPEEEREICRRIYDSLDVEYRMAERLGGENCAAVMPPVSSLSVRQDERQSSLEIRIHRIGADLEERIGELYRAYPLTGVQTANVFLNINDRFAADICRSLKKKGYFFTGLKPLCSSREYLVLHHPGQVEMHPEDYRLTEEFRALFQALKIGG